MIILYSLSYYIFSFPFSDLFLFFLFLVVDPGTKVQKAFFDNLKTEVKDFEIFIASFYEPSFGAGEMRLPLNSKFLFFYDDLLSTCFKHYKKK